MADKSRVAANSYHSVHLPEDPARAVVWQAVAAYLAKWIPPQARVLELGAGYCCWINAVHAARRTAMDKWADLPRHAAPGVRAVIMDARDVRTLGAGDFDVVLASNFLEHFDPDAAAGIVGDVAALLGTDGRFIVVQPNFRLAWRRYFDDYTHRSIFTDVSLANLLRSRGFRIDVCMPRFLPYSMRQSRLPITRWTVGAYLRSPIKPWAGQMLIVASKT